MSNPTLRPLTTDDLSAVYALWQEALDDQWPLGEAELRRVLFRSPAYRPGDHLALEIAGRLVGLVATLTRTVAGTPPRGAILLLVVSPVERRRGYGSQLLQAGLERLRAAGVSEARLGGGAGAYFWPGVPENLPEALGFFRATGWEFTNKAADMCQDLAAYTTPDYVFARTRACGAALRLATAEDSERILAFEQEHFPNWYPSFESAVKQLHEEPGMPSEIVYAEDADGRVVGTVRMHSPGRTPGAGHPQLWHALLGAQNGAFGAVGVAEEARERGIGLALSAYASETLKARGTRLCHVGWVWSVAWYAKLGYQLWREYVQGRKAL